MEIKTPCGPITLPDSVRTHSNEKKFAKVIKDQHGGDGTISVTIRWDDHCNNGHNTFSLTGALRTGRDSIGGCIHEEIARYMPEFAKYIPYHLVSADGPLHYFANTTYFAGDRDFNGARSGEQRRDEGRGKMWQLAASPYSVCFSDEQPAPQEYPYEPVLDANGEQARNFEGVPLWQEVGRPYAKIASEVAPKPRTQPYRPVLGEGKECELDAARRAAVWPDASDEVLSQDKPELEKALAQRLPALMDEFKAVVESLDFVY